MSIYNIIVSGFFMLIQTADSVDSTFLIVQLIAKEESRT